MPNLDNKIARLKTGDEILIFNDKSIGFKLLDFWKWNVSDLLSNATRGRFAEFIVGTAMGIDLTEVRDEWGDYDLETWEWGKLRIEVKSSSYLQSWYQYNFSKIIFSIKRKNDPNKRLDANEYIRPSDVYVLCLLNHKDKKTVDTINLNQWVFYVVSTKTINNIFKNIKSISLKSLEKITEGIKYSELKEKIINEYKKL
jgi:hypothetical protein